jgi:hypothetical protein
MDLSLTQLLSFEIGKGCNLAAAHKYCPVNKRDQFPKGGAPLTDEVILAFCQACKDEGFKGRVAYHFYCEPTLYLDRVLCLTEKVKELALGSVLWTNGILIEDPAPWVEKFEKVYITDHNPARRDLYQSWVIRWEGRVHIKPGGNDSRENLYATPARKRAKPCFRPMVGEIPVDNNGWVHLCCTDWAGKTRIGNIMCEDHDLLLLNWKHYVNLASSGSLLLCQQCQSMPRNSMLPTKENRF